MSKFDGCPNCGNLYSLPMPNDRCSSCADDDIEGQDRESYSDDQDRESYSTTPARIAEEHRLELANIGVAS